MSMFLSTIKSFQQCGLIHGSDGLDEIGLPDICNWVAPEASQRLERGNRDWALVL